jgi:hypothetical protein
VISLKYYDFVFGFIKQKEDELRLENLKLGAPDPLSAIILFQFLSQGCKVKNFVAQFSIVTTYYHQVKEYELVKMDSENQFQFVLLRIYDRQEISKLF